MSTVRDVLNQWMDAEITVVNPHSFAETAIKDVIRMGGSVKDFVPPAVERRLLERLAPAVGK